jgi:hypothetical protein
MEAFILIYVILTTQGSATGTAQFGSKDACVIAGEKVVSHINGTFRTAHYICARQNGVGGDE